MHPVLNESQPRAKALLSSAGLFAVAVVFSATQLAAQSATVTSSAGTPAAPVSSGPIAIVPLENGKSGDGAKVTGALEVTSGKAIIAASGTITSGTATTEVLLPHRGTLRVCASTTVKLGADSSVATGDTPGLMMALDHGAIEASFAAGRNADFILTPDFRILIGGPGAVEVKVRLGQHGDTCVDNPGGNAPYVLVTSVFDGGAYRVQASQRVMFQHGSVHEVVDQEKEPCGCPPEPKPGSNEFPLAQSAGLAPMPAAKPSPAHPAVPSQVMEPLVYKSPGHTPQPAAAAPQAIAPASVSAPTAAPAKSTQPHPKKRGFFRSVGHFFRRIFGAE